jgi:1-acyl-sn-glycerol-3-phosphate acyltransferase
LYRPEKPEKHGTFAEMSADKFVDIEKIIGSKNPKLLKWMPGFVLRYIKHILHEDYVNAFMKEHGHLRDLDFVHKVMEVFNTKVVVKGIENIPAEGGFILASNHPLGGFDGLALMQAVGMKRKDIRFLVNDILLSLGTMDNLFVAVNKHGSQHAKAKIEEAYASEHAVLIFPAGLVSRKNDGVIRDLEWKKSFIVKSLQYKKPVVPCFIEGKNSSWFYNLSLWRRRLGIKANIEMFYLVDEMYRQRDQTITIIFDQPVPSNKFDSSRTPIKWAAQMKEHIYALAAGKKGPFSV